jgi:hypothetical protein
VRKDLAETINLAGNDFTELGRLLALDRYERCALTKRGWARNGFARTKPIFGQNTVIERVTTEMTSSGSSGESLLKAVSMQTV